MGYVHGDVIFCRILRLSSFAIGEGVNSHSKATHHIFHRLLVDISCCMCSEKEYWSTCHMCAIPMHIICHVYIYIYIYVYEVCQIKIHNDGRMFSF